jgi:flagellar biosynthesis protein FlhF
MAQLKQALSRMAERGMSPAAAIHLRGFGRKVYEDLVARGVDETAAQDIGQRVTAEGDAGQEAVRKELERLMGPGTPITVQKGQRKVVALIGPTGVGKTTTLAKLAAQFTLERGLKVAMLTSDTFRIAAIEQLRTYAEILGVPMHAVDTPADVAKALQETASCDLVLVDTGGRNHKDAQRMQELRDLLAVLRPDETHLVFSLTANPRDAFEALDYYLPMGVNRLIFTKLDEASAPGLLLNVRMRCNQPVGYVTVGQSVPDDLLPADRADFSKILLGA